MALADPLRENKRRTNRQSIRLISMSLVLHRKTLRIHYRVYIERFSVGIHSENSEPDSETAHSDL